MTAAQVQHLLAFLGFYKAPVDGLSGPQTKTAVRDFQTAFGGLEADGIPGKATQTALCKAVGEGWEKPVTQPEENGGAFWAEIRYFTREEFRCKCGGKYCDGFPAEPQEKLVRAAEEVREHFGRPITVSSGVRCETHNARVGGVSNSRHRSGKAMDFCVSGSASEAVLAYVQGMEEIRYAYCIDRSYIHMDIE